MRRALAWGIVYPSAMLLAQPAAILAPDSSAKPDSQIQGLVLSDADGSPLRRSRVTLQPVDPGQAGIGVEADDHGAFTIRNIPPGSYALSAQRDGFLSAGVALHDGLRLPPTFSISKGQNVTGITFRLRPWAVMTGKVRYDDGEPAIGVRVDLYRPLRFRGHVTYRNVASTATNDRGEYRIHGLPPGEYDVAAAYERNTERVEDQPQVDTQGRNLPTFGYATTFYPDTLKLGEAVPVRLEAGREIGGIDLTLQQTRKVTLRGRVTSGVTGGSISATMFLSRLDADNSGGLTTPVRASFDRNSAFEIRNVAPGSYQVWAEATADGKRLVGRKTLLVSNDDVDAIEIIAMEPRNWTGRVRVEGAEMLPEGYVPRVRLEPRNERAAPAEAPARGTFSLPVLPTEVYDAFVPNLPGDFYLSGVRVGGTDVRSTGLDAAAASDAGFEIVLDSRGGRVGGRLFDAQGNPMSGASVALIPDPVRLQDYRDGSADEYGQFGIRGIAPGKYTLLAWLDEPPCDIYDVAALDACRAAGVSLNVVASGERVDSFTIRAPK